jgi:transcriptional regulator with XRE-family HTH domain
MMIIEEQVNMRQVGERLLVLRRRAGLTQQDLSRQAGVDVMTISRVESGRKKRMEVESLARLATVLAVTTDYLLGREQEPAPAAQAKATRQARASTGNTGQAAPASVKRPRASKAAPRA